MSVVDKIMARPGYFAAVTAVSVGIGFGTYFAAGFIKNKIDKMMEEACPEEDEYPEVPEPDDPSEYGLPNIPDGVNDIEDMEKVIGPNFRKPDLDQMVDYTKYSDISKQYDTSDEEKVVEGDETNEVEELDDGTFQIISEEDYMDTSHGMVKADGTYFTQEKLLAGWNESLAEKDISSTIGWKAAKMFDDPSIQSVYVRNNALRVDYEIVRCDDPFEEVVQEVFTSGE